MLTLLIKRFSLKPKKNSRITMFKKNLLNGLSLNLSSIKPTIKKNKQQIIISIFKKRNLNKKIINIKFSPIIGPPIKGTGDL